MNGLSPTRLKAAVASLCPDIEAQVASTPVVLDEERLWWTLSCCLFSSQVPYSLALAAAGAVKESGLLLASDQPTDDLSDGLASVLSGPLRVENHIRYYRFPKGRARQLAETRSAVIRSGGSLRSLLELFTCPEEARSWFVERAPGMGPKQASMFLRNSGISYDLAIIDRHVVRYMNALGLIDGCKPGLNALKGYRRQEMMLRAHARDLGCSVGLLDWAIWIVMRVAVQDQMELPFE